MRQELEVIASKLRGCKLIFNDSDYEEFLWKYALETMIFENVPVTGKQKGYMSYLMKQKAMDMLKKAEYFYFLEDKEIPLKHFGNDDEIKSMVRREHMYGRPEIR